MLQFYPFEIVKLHITLRTSFAVVSTLFYIISYLGADVEKSESVNKNTKGSVIVHVNSKSGTSTEQDSVIGNKSDSNTKQPNPVIGPRKAAKPNNVFKVNTSSLISAPSKSNISKKQEALSDPKGSEENLRCYPSSQVKSNISPVVKPSTSSTLSTLLTAKNSTQSSWELGSMTISRKKPVMRIIPEANVDRFGSSNSKNRNLITYNH
ncbi:hypothetical protein Anas_07497 [Armadillidium nasatum]|uniref:Uncharacterized protein n=1 Tax=Armadillidium nasatum TaxID=96803 RepID=A0A5N5T6F7_9CRUS|nr:hypothetical protein Anas_07497 [Armadillidium nasatum]